MFKLIEIVSDVMKKGHVNYHCQEHLVKKFYIIMIDNEYILVINNTAFFLVFYFSFATNL